MVSEKNQSKNVCVIGAGPAGIVVARELRKEGHKAIVIEQNHDIGGQWLYDDKNIEGEHPLGKNPYLKLHSSVYNSLRVASPREVMGFTDFPFSPKKGRDMRRFPSHVEVLMYLKDFCEYFGLRDMIRFNTRVEYVGMLDDYGVCGNDLKWIVRSKEKNSEKVVEEVFDAVVVATGHYSQPKLPSIKGMDTWKRKQIHSHIYRTPEPFHNEVVVVVGNSFSGQDLAMELVGVAKEVHISARSLHTVYEGLKKVISKHDTLHLHPQIDTLEEDGRVIFLDGTCIKADTIVYCTGYSYSFPFLDTKGMVVVENDKVGPLYEHTFPPSLAPSLSFAGIPKKILGFPFFESQAMWIAQLLSGKKALPSWEEMMKSIKEFYQSREEAGIPTHDIGDFEYCDKYSENVGLPPLQEWRKSLTIASLINSFVNLETFRESWNDEENEMLQEALQSPYFTQLELQD
ncbi:hypothetical protein P8452_25834 [Trifolium repens]|nr:flavin-binding monooxygenase family protein [Trifolium repens]WJX38140.1 hypothetical protein P8452_25834 [Trifolium repens]